jgi:hypothetical protein
MCGTRAQRSSVMAWQFWFLATTIGIAALIATLYGFFAAYRQSIGLNDAVWIGYGIPDVVQFASDEPTTFAEDRPRNTD